MECRGAQSPLPPHRQQGRPGVTCVGPRPGMQQSDLRPPPVSAGPAPHHLSQEQPHTPRRRAAVAAWRPEEQKPGLHGTGEGGCRRGAGPARAASGTGSVRRRGERDRKRHRAESAGNSFPRRGRLSGVGPAGSTRAEGSCGARAAESRTGRRGSTAERVRRSAEPGPLPGCSCGAAAGPGLHGWPRPHLRRFAWIHQAGLQSVPGSPVNSEFRKCLRVLGCNSSDASLRFLVNGPVLLYCAFPVRCFKSFSEIAYVFSRLWELSPISIHCNHTCVSIQYLKALSFIFFFFLYVYYHVLYSKCKSHILVIYTNGQNIRKDPNQALVHSAVEELYKYNLCL